MIIKCPKCKSEDLFKPIKRDGWKFWICQGCGHEFRDLRE